MDNKPSHEALEDSLPKIKRPLERVVFVRFAILITIVTIFVSIASYFQYMASIKELVRDQLFKYVHEREHRESALFLESDAYQLRFQKEYVERYNRTSDDEAMEWLAEHMEKRTEDGTYRSKPELYHGKDMPLGRRDVAATMMIGAETEITAEVVKALAIGYDMVNQYGPAWRKPFDDLYFSAPEKTSVSRWPGTPWGLMMDDKVEWREEEWFAITTIAKNPQREQRWSGVLYDERNGNWMVSGVTPLDIDGKQVGMVGTDLMLDDLVDRTVNDVLAGTYNILLQADGRVIAHPDKIDEIIASKGMLMAQNSPDEHLSHIYEHAQTATTFPTVIDHEEYDEFIAVTQIKGPDWYFVTVYPKSLLASRALRNVGFIILSGIASLAAMFLIIWFVLRRNLVSPLGRLTQAVRNFNISQGQWSDQADDFVEKASMLSTRPDEIGLLANSFVDMGAHLRTTYDKLQKSEGKYRSLVSNIPGATYRCRVDKHWTMEFISDEIEKLSGYPATDFLQNSVRSYASIIHPEDLPISDRIVLESIARKEPFTIEYRIINSDGDIHWVYEKGQGLYDEQGEVCYLDGVIVDITDRKQAEEALYMTQYSVDKAVFGVFWITEDAHFAYVNDMACETLGYSRDELLKLTIPDIGPDFDMDIWKLHWEELRQKKSFNVETKHRRKDGSVFPVEITINYLEYNGVGYNFAYASDITDRKRVEAERERLLKTIQAKNDELQSIVYVASHDLRSPLVNIEGFGGELAATCLQIKGMLSDDSISPDLKQDLLPLLDERVPESLNFIKAGTSKMSSLLDGLLQVSRVGSVKVNIKPLDMNMMLADIRHSMEFQINDAGAELIIKDMPDCLGDEAMINQVFSNIIGNALKYLDPDRKGEMIIQGHIENGNCIYCVEDNGIGVDLAHQEKIFELFHRLNPNDSAGGEGLGLTIITRILDRLNGDIRVESEPGKGSKFFVSLPRIKG
jgi:PAS domain S-box-containing protein